MLGLAAALLIASPALAQQRPFDPATLPDADRLLEACKKPVQDLYDSGVTAKMREASIQTVACLRKAIIGQVREIFPNPDAAVARFEKHFDHLAEGDQRIHWELYNETRYCSQGGCGTNRHVMHAAAHVGLMHTLLRDILAYRKAEGF